MRSAANRHRMRHSATGMQKIAPFRHSLTCKAGMGLFFYSVARSKDAERRE